MSTSREIEPQRLSPLYLTECRECHARVYFRARSSTPSTDPRFKVEYLYCPVCGATATQIREVEVLTRRLVVKSRVKYHYRA